MFCSTQTNNSDQHFSNSKLPGTFLTLRKIPLISLVLNTGLMLRKKLIMTNRNYLQRSEVWLSRALLKTEVFSLKKMLIKFNVLVTWGPWELLASLDPVLSPSTDSSSSAASSSVSPSDISPASRLVWTFTSWRNGLLETLVRNSLLRSGSEQVRSNCEIIDKKIL